MLLGNLKNSFFWYNGIVNIIIPRIQKKAFVTSSVLYLIESRRKIGRWIVMYRYALMASRHQIITVKLEPFKMIEIRQYMFPKSHSFTTESTKPGRNTKPLTRPAALRLINRIRLNNCSSCNWRNIWMLKMLLKIIAIALRNVKLLSRRTSVRMIQVSNFTAHISIVEKMVEGSHDKIRDL